MQGVEGCPASSYGDIFLLKKDGTDRVRTRYDRISPYYDLIELLLENVVFRRWRKMVFDSLNGDAILEVGVGTGKNFDFYPQDKRITAIDFSPGMLTKAHRRAIRQGVDVDILEMDVQDLQFDDRSFDMVVATFVFCSVPDPIRGLEEIKRVSKKGGKIILLEHV
jgi:ubiquinone/menaquinone biosynthesis C-methylase UbiE